MLLSSVPDPLHSLPTSTSYHQPSLLTSTLSHHINPLPPHQPSPTTSTLSHHINPLPPHQPSPTISTVSYHINPLPPHQPSPTTSTVSYHIKTDISNEVSLHFYVSISLYLHKGGLSHSPPILKNICGCHNFFHLSSVQIIIIPACCLLCVL